MLLMLFHSCSLLQFDAEPVGDDLDVPELEEETTEDVEGEDEEARAARIEEDREWRAARHAEDLAAASDSRPGERSVREILSSFGFDAAATPFVRGSALCALAGTHSKAGRDAIHRLLAAVEAHIPTPLAAPSTASAEMCRSFFADIYVLTDNEVWIEEGAKGSWALSWVP